MHILKQMRNKEKRMKFLNSCTKILLFCSTRLAFCDITLLKITCFVFSSYVPFASRPNTLGHIYLTLNLKATPFCLKKQGCR